MARKKRAPCAEWHSVNGGRGTFSNRGPARSQFRSEARWSHASALSGDYCLRLLSLGGAGRPRSDTPSRGHSCPTEDGTRKPRLTRCGSLLDVHVRTALPHVCPTAAPRNGDPYGFGARRQESVHDPTSHRHGDTRCWSARRRAPATREHTGPMSSRACGAGVTEVEVRTLA